MEIEEVRNCTIFECLAGSHAYGTNTPESDVDIRGVCCPTDLSYYIGMGIKRFEQQEKGWPEGEDKVIYDLRKIVNLMADNNPNCLELLFTDPRYFLTIKPEWEVFIENRDLFLSKKVRYSYAGYAHAQLKRIKRHRNYLLNPPTHKPERSEFGLPQRKLVNSEQAGAYQWLLAKILEDGLEYMKLSQETREELRGVNFIGAIQSDIPDETSHVLKEVTGATDEWVESIMREKRYGNAMKGWNAYQNWRKTRNKKRQALEDKFQLDTKHAMHLVRLMRQGMEIMEGKRLVVFRPDAEELLAIRNGAWSYEQLEEYADECDKKMDELYKTSSLPKQPNRNKIDEICQNVIGNYVFGGEILKIETDG